MGRTVRYAIGRAWRASTVFLLCLSVVACAGRADGPEVVDGLGGQSPPRGLALSMAPSANAILHNAAYAVTPDAGLPRIVDGRRLLQCVPYARELSGVAIIGNAWTWWGRAEGRYQRGHQPEVWAVMVLRRRGRSLGHVAVVTEILNDREVVVRHANWLNNGRVHLDTPVRDVSRYNDWSAVRVWYTPGQRYGAGTYAAYGFIYPRIETATR